MAGFNGICSSILYDNLFKNVRTTLASKPMRSLISDGIQDFYEQLPCKSLIAQVLQNPVWVWLHIKCALQSTMSSHNGCFSQH